jgi:tetratricopeptide (TPR) repeat protein
MRRLSIALAAAVALGASAPILAQSADFERARQARLAGRLDEAERLLRPIVAARPGEYLVVYNMGLVHEGRAARLPPGVQKLAQLDEAIRWLEKARSIREARGVDEYTIYNTLGHVYFQRGDVVKAEAIWRGALRYQDRLSPVSRAKLHGNLGYLYAVTGDTKRAEMHLQQAASANRGAADNLAKLRAVQTMRPRAVQQTAGN